MWASSGLSKSQNSWDLTLGQRSLKLKQKYCLWLFYFYSSMCMFYANKPSLWAAGRAVVCSGYCGVEGQSHLLCWFWLAEWQHGGGLLTWHVWEEDLGEAGPQFNIKTSSYQYRKSHCGDKTVVRSSYLHSGIPILIRCHLYIESWPWKESWSSETKCYPWTVAGDIPQQWEGDIVSSSVHPFVHLSITLEVSEWKEKKLLREEGAEKLLQLYPRKDTT